jgi:DNA polymerase-3 subunit delta'
VSYPWITHEHRAFTLNGSQDRQAHACLIAGPKGLGKYQLAQDMALSLLCQEGEEQSCGQCRSCQLFRTGAHPDFRLISFELNTNTDKMRTELVIEQIRNLNASMQLTNSLSPHKVALIYPAEAMNRSSANALLKTLEEPQGEAVIILVSHQPSRLPATIRSRCQNLVIRLPDEQTALNWLVTEKGADGEDARIALKASAGSPLGALQMLEDGSLTQFRAVFGTLKQVEADPSAVSEAMSSWSELDQENLWNWLSLIAAQRFRSCFGLGVRGQASDSSLNSNPALAAVARKVSAMQTLADRNRNLMASALRKDLLLRDWLIQWSRLGS